MLALTTSPKMSSLIKASVMFYRRGGPEGRWQFLPTDDAEIKDFERERPELLKGIDTSDPTKNGFIFAPSIYKLGSATSTQTSVPILFDSKSKKVVSNESADIVRMFSTLSGTFDLDKVELIDELNSRIYQDVNNGAYRAGFTSNQASHEEASAKYFKAFDWLDGLLSKSKYLIGDDKPSEVDLRLFPTIYRHDPVYFSRMKLNVAMVRDYPNLNRWFLDMKKVKGVEECSRLDNCVAGYFGRTGNGIVPFEGLTHDGVMEY